MKLWLGSLKRWSACGASCFFIFSSHICNIIDLGKLDLGKITQFCCHGPYQGLILLFHVWGRFCIYYKLWEGKEKEWEKFFSLNDGKEHHSRQAINGQASVKWFMTHRVLKFHWSKIGIIYIQSWKQCSIPVMTTMTYFAAIHALGPKCMSCWW